MQEPRTEPADRGEMFPNVPWTGRDLVLCSVVVLVALFFVSLAIIGPFEVEYGRYAPETLVASGVANLVWNAVTIAAVLFFVYRSGANLFHLGLRNPEGPSSRWLRLAGLAVAVFMSLYLVTFTYGVIVEVFGLDFLEPDPQIPDEFYDSDVALAVLGVGIVIGAPITEELFFRGFLFGGARRYLGVIGAAVVTGFLFSLAHYNPGLIIPFTGIGAVFALSYHYTRSIYVPMGAHLLFNLVSYSILVFVPDARP
jgi:membrane protease YdiL (CAAX protease family)